MPSIKDHSSEFIQALPPSENDTKSSCYQVITDHNNNVFYPEAYKYFGSHYDPKTKQTTFRLAMASKALGIELHLYNANSNKDSPDRILEMEKQIHPQFGVVWELKISDAPPETMYLYRIRDGESTGQETRLDPYGRKVAFAELPGYAASFRGRSVVMDDAHRVVELPKQEKSSENRSENREEKKPLRILEVHPRTFTENPHISFSELAEILVQWCKKIGYNAVSLMPVHMADPASLGYRILSYLALMSDHGGADEFKKFIDKLHANNIKVFIDFVYSHSASDINGLGNLNGLFRHKTPYNSVYNDFTHVDVINLGLSALHYMMTLGVDGYRCDAVELTASHPDPGNFQRAMNFFELCNWLFPSALKIAEDTSNRLNLGKLGFNRRWATEIPHRILNLISKPFFDKSALTNLIQYMSLIENAIVYIQSHDNLNRFHKDPDTQLPQLPLPYQFHTQFIWGHKKINNKENELSIRYYLSEIFSGMLALVPGPNVDFMVFQGQDYGENYAYKNGKSRGWDQDTHLTPFSDENMPIHQKNLLKWNQKLFQFVQENIFYYRKTEIINTSEDGRVVSLKIITKKNENDKNEEEQTYIVLMNFGQDVYPEYEIPLNDFRSHSWDMVLNNQNNLREEDGRLATATKVFIHDTAQFSTAQKALNILNLPPWSFIVLAERKEIKNSQIPQ